MRPERNADGSREPTAIATPWGALKRPSFYPSVLLGIAAGAGWVFLICWLAGDSKSDLLAEVAAFGSIGVAVTGFYLGLLLFSKEVE